MKSTEAKILQKMKEPYAAGFYENRNAPCVKKFSRAICRHLASIDINAISGQAKKLFPQGEINIWQFPAGKVACYHSHSFSLEINPVLFEEKMQHYLASDTDLENASNIRKDLQNWCANPLSQKYRVGGGGFTHTILNYEKILSIGLPGYRQEIADGLKQNSGKRDFYEAADEVLSAIMLFLNRAVESLKPGDLRDALQAAGARAPETFYEAMVLFNFAGYLDYLDSFGDIDVFLTPFFERDIASCTITEAEVVELLDAFYRNVDACNGWHMILGGKGAAPRLTELCLQAINTRRPNSGLKITPETSDAVWDQAFDAMSRHTGNPALYNDAAYRESALEYAGVNPDDLDKIAYGGCTEFMVAGKSNVGSIDSGVNLLEILDGALDRLTSVPDFETFLEKYKQDICREIARCIEETQLNQQCKATYRPQLIRSLFIDDCLASGIEYNKGGARYNGGVINVVGIANTANSLYAIKQAYEGGIDLSVAELQAVMDKDYAGAESAREMLRHLPKYGNNCADVDALAHEVSDLAFSEILQYKCWRGNGFYIPSVIMFVTYVGEGVNIGATPDGRMATSPIADSCGPMQGTDLEGVTSMLNSTACLPHHKGLGTTILNMRIPMVMVKDPVQREKLKSLIKSYFDMGGLQVQISVLDAETLKKADKYPEQFENLVIRVGGYTEYFNRLNPKLKREVIKRTTLGI